MEYNLEKYDFYKPSGFEWLGEVPEHWQTIKMKYIFRDFSQKNKPNEELLSVTQDQGVVPRSWVGNRMVMPSGDLDSFKYIEKGDFAISLRSFEGGLEYCYHSGIISPAYTVLKSQRPIHDSYYKYLFKSQAFISELQTSVVGIREGKNISYSELSYSFLPIHSFEEQQKIAEFLDQKNSQIDKAVALKERQIELLKEHRQIIIHKAVTRGLDENAPLKDSGIKWIGEIPEHWTVKKLKYIASIKGGFAFNSSTFKSDGVQIIKIANLYLNELSLERQPTYIDESFLKSHKDWIVSKGDILISLTGTLGKKDYGYAILIDKNDKFLLNQRVGKISPNYIIEKEYILNILQSEMYLNQLYMLPSGTKQANLSNDDILNVRIAFPEAKREREAILNYIIKMKKNIAKAIYFKEQEIERLKEYKSGLINSAVTGKIRVS